MDQARRPLGFFNPWRVAGVSKKAFPAELWVFSSTGFLSISLAGLQRVTGSKFTAQLVMAQQLWQGRNVTGPCCQTTTNGWLKIWMRAKRGFLQRPRHHMGVGRREGLSSSLWVIMDLSQDSFFCVCVCTSFIAAFETAVVMTVQILCVCEAHMHRKLMCTLGIIWKHTLLWLVQGN